MTDERRPTRADEPPPENRVVTGHTLAFALLSAFASLTPLFAEAAGLDFARGLDRGSSLAWYGAALLLHFGLIMPGGFARTPGKSLRPWAALAIFSGAFAALPAAVAAYVSGVRADDLLALAAAPAATAACALLARATLGARAPAAFVPIFLLVAFVLPGAALFCHAFGVRAPFEDWLAASPTAHVWRLATRRPVEGVAVWWIVAAAAFAGACFFATRSGSKGRSGVRAAAAIVVAAGLSAGFAAFPQDAATEARIEARVGPVTRAGARTPLRVVAPRGDGLCELLFEAGTVVVPRDGVAYDVAVVLTPREIDVGIRMDGVVRRAPLPTAPADATTTLIAAVSVPESPEVVRVLASPPASCAVSAIGDGRGLSAGELEAFDAIVVSETAYVAATADVRDALDAFAAMGGSLVVLDGGARRPSVASFGEGRRVRAARVEDVDFASTRRRPSDAFDPALRSLFVRPDWARVDLGPLALFLVLYHVAFLAAFLLPWRLDGRKSSNVYLASTGFVVAVVVFGGRAALKSFFFKDNQVATQSFTVATFDGKESPTSSFAVLRQWRLFASMSGETRTLPAPRGSEGVVYRDRGAAPLRFEVSPSGARVVDAPLDRYASMTLMREDRFGAAPLVVSTEVAADGIRARLSPSPAAPDPAGLRFATPRRAWLVDGAAPAIEGVGTADGTFLFPTAGGAASRRSVEGSAELPTAFRSVVARVLPAGETPPRRRVVFFVDGVRRLDDASGYFFVEDRGAALVFVLAP